MLTEAVILAGGFGTRLQSVVSDVPKPMAPVAGKPFLAWILDHLAAHHFTRIVLSVGYKHEAIVAFFGDQYQGMEILYSVEETALGTGGAVKLAMENVTTDHVLVLNGDTFFQVNVLEMYDAHIESNADITIALREMKNVDRYGSVELDEDFRVLEFTEKQFREQTLINGGVYIFKNEVFEQFELEEKFSLEADFLEPNLSEIVVMGFQSDGYFIDIGIPTDYEKAQNDFISFPFSA